MAASLATPEAMAYIVKHGTGIVSVVQLDFVSRYMSRQGSYWNHFQGDPTLREFQELSLKLDVFKLTDPPRSFSHASTASSHPPLDAPAVWPLHPRSYPRLQLLTDPPPLLTSVPHRGSRSHRCRRIRMSILVPCLTRSGDPPRAPSPTPRPPPPPHLDAPASPASHRPVSNSLIGRAIRRSFSHALDRSPFPPPQPDAPASPKIRAAKAHWITMKEYYKAVHLALGTRHVVSRVAEWVQLKLLSIKELLLHYSIASMLGCSITPLHQCLTVPLLQLFGIERLVKAYSKA
ncbi:hypothetical protein Syun_020985 [Stephania yunnanensis]|uniref:Uncharacterized protein n=1 Tax=Stephania yunnanensis TaxID=152371 RepID=A0AAP0NPD2_9MAGN